MSGHPFIERGAARVSWIKLDDGFAQHPKLIGVGPEGLTLQVRAFCYAGRYLTDGLIPFDVADSLSHGLSHPSTSTWAEVMEAAGLWERKKTGFYIHDYLVYNPTRKHVIEQRQRKSEGGKKGAENRWHITPPITTPIRQPIARPIHEPMVHPIGSSNAPHPLPQKKENKNLNPRSPVLASPDRESKGFEPIGKLGTAVHQMMPAALRDDIEPELIVRPDSE